MRTPLMSLPEVLNNPAIQQLTQKSAEAQAAISNSVSIGLTPIRRFSRPLRTSTRSTGKSKRSPPVSATRSAIGMK